MTQKTRNRAIILLAAAITGSFTGAVYMWSIFNEPLMQAHGWPLQQVSLAYSLFIGVDCISCMLAGALQRKMKSSTLLLIAGMLFGVGYILTGFATTIPMLYLTYCVIAGFGDGFIYNIAVSTATKWFPEKRGFANGICIGCVGLSPLVWAPLGNFFIEAFGAEMSFRIIGAIALLLFIIFARFVDAPDPGWKPEGWNPDPIESAGMENDLTTGQAIRQPLFWALFALYTAAVISGNMVAAHASDIGQALAGMTASQGALMVGLLAVGNFSGRLGFGAVSDRIGCYKTLAIMLTISGAVMLLFTQISSFVPFMVALCVAGACFGGVMTNMPTLCSDFFGMKNFSQTYSVLYGAYTAACFIGPMLAAAIVTATGTFDLAFLISGAIAFSSLGLIVLVRHLAKARA